MSFKMQVLVNDIQKHGLKGSRSFIAAMETDRSEENVYRVHSVKCVDEEKIPLMCGGGPINRGRPTCQLGSGQTRAYLVSAIYRLTRQLKLFIHDLSPLRQLQFLFDSYSTPFSITTSTGVCIYKLLATASSVFLVLQIKQSEWTIFYVK